MLATHLGFYNTSSSRTHVRLQFSTHQGAGGNVAPVSAFEAADIRIYRAADGAAFSNTQRSSANGITMTSPFDTLVGVHDVDIDLTDNTDAGFYASGYLYSVMLAPDETIDGETITGVVLAYFEIGPQPVNVVSIANGAITAAAVATGAIDADALAADAVAAIVDGVLDEPIAGHTSSGSVGEAIDNAGAGGTPPSAADIADAVWDEDLTGHTTPDSAGLLLGTAGATTDAQIADKILGRNIAGGSDGGRTVTDAFRLLRNKSSISAGTLTVTEEDDSTPAWTAAVTTAAGDPITGLDPA
jgi:hypothetical protein